VRQRGGDTMTKRTMKRGTNADGVPARRLGVVAVGASAGGLEALDAMLGSMPVDIGAAFVIVTHQHTGQASLLPELLGKSCGLPVSKAVDGMCVEANHVYVGMPGCLLEIAGGVLRCCPLAATDVGDRAIDHFMRFLAADQGEFSVGVILSGAGSDGTLGVRAIKAAGGMVMAQDPSMAKFDSMPASAIATGLVDYVLSPATMPSTLIEYLRCPYLRSRASKVDSGAYLPEDMVSRILLRLREVTGHDFSGYKRSTIARRIERRMNVLHIAEPVLYLAFLNDHPNETRLLMQELLISVTSFFRDPEAFLALSGKALAPLLESRGEAPLRVWVPGCATGEEAYSVAILLLEQMQNMQQAPNLQVFGTDLDGHAISVARGGLYPEGIIADVSTERLARYFVREDGCFRVCRAIRERLVFAVQDLLRDPPFTRLDLIVCRNVLIYLTADAQRRLIPVFHYALHPGGLLFLGSSESIGGMHAFFETVDSKWKIYRRLESAGALPSTSGPSFERRVPPVPATVTVGRPGESGLGPHVQRLLTTRFAPPSVVVDAQGNIVYVQGRTGMFLEPMEGQPSHNILHMAREGLAAALATALRRATADNLESVRDNVRVRTNHEFTRVNVTVSPIGDSEPLRGLYLVTLQPVVNPGPEPVADDPGLSATAREMELEMEVLETRRSLEATIGDLGNANEELLTGNEELQSANEELQSTNEELETSKEELQSLNEELNTVNAEFQSKVEALALSNDDMRNLLNSTQVGCVFLDEDLRVKRYTEKACELIRLIESDLGRPMEDLATTLVYDRLVADCRQVLDTLVPVEAEVPDRSGHWYLLRVLPYRTGENVFDGVVVTLVNIDRVREAGQTKADMTSARDLLGSIVRTAREPLAVLDSQCRIVLVNAAFHREFHTRSAGIEGCLLFDLGNGLWNSPRLRELLENVLPAKTVVEDFRIEDETPDRRRRVFLLNARCLDTPPGLPAMVLLAMEEVMDK